MASVLKVDKLDPQSGTALEIGTSGDTITVPSGATFAVSGTMNASSITAGTVATARLGSGTASSSTILYGDQTYKAEPTGGKILQVVSGITTSSVDNATNTFADTGLTASITCAATSSKVLIMISQDYRKANSTSGVFQLLRDASVIDVIDGLGYTGNAETSSSYYAFNYLDSPSSTSALAYKTQFKSGDNIANVSCQTNSNPSTIILMEIGA
jgi:hypothetical protein